jgi:chain length determinant protein (polysaccharide antigen chain regulator)
MNNLQTQPRYDGNELSLFDLIKLFWQYKRLIIVITFFCVVVMALYLKFATPVYEARAYVIPPRIDDVMRINTSRSSTEPTSMKNYRVNDVYNIFGAVLMSDSLKRNFFESVYFPSLNQQQKNISRNILFKNYLNNIGIKEESKKTLKYTVIIKTESKIKSEDFVKQYILLADKEALSVLQESIDIQNKIKSEDILQKIERIRDLAKRDREDKLVQLHKALIIAKAAGIQDVTNAGFFKKNDDWSTLFMLGTKALESEIKILKASEMSDSFTPKLRRLESEFNFYSKLRVPVENIKMFRLEEVVNSSPQPVYPNKTLMMLIVLIGGLMLSFAIVFVINLFPGKNCSRVT